MDNFGTVLLLPPRMDESKQNFKNRTNELPDRALHLEYKKSFINILRKFLKKRSNYTSE